VYSTLQAGPEFREWLSGRPAARAPRPNPEPAVLLTRSDTRLELTLNRPERRNAISVEVRDALVEGLRLVVCDPSIEEVVLRGVGSAFCAGGDLDEFGTLPDPATAHGIRSIRNPARLLADCGDRVRAELQGACVGAGIELPAFASRVVAAEDAFFQLPEVAMGLVPGAGGTVSITRRIGRQRTAYLALSGVRLDAPTAHRWGLVDEIGA
jgi:enoyl-CoA hydratase/carnithine racemase